MLTMFDSDKSRCELYVPKRLPRADVASLRELYQRAFTKIPWPQAEHGSLAGWSTKLVIYATRNRRERSMARLRGGHDTARVELTAQWYMIEALGLNVEAWAYSPHRYGQDSLKVGTHRFRPTTTQAEFCRQLSLLVRYGIGWCRERDAQLARIL